MKKVIVLTFFAAFAATALKAQDIPDRKRGEFKPVEKERLFNKKELANLNLTDEQKAKLKLVNKDLRDQMTELRKQDNLTVKEMRDKMQALRKDHLAQLQSVFTPEQKAQMEKDKEAFHAKMKGLGEKRQAKMKEELNLTDEQSAKLVESRKATMEKMKAIREDNSLKDDEKKERVKELMKQQKETMQTILTKEQLGKMKETRKKHSKKKEEN